MKILYVSSWHSVLEYSDLEIFNTLDIDWFSTGCFLDPNNPRYYPGYEFKKNPLIASEKQLDFINSMLPFYVDNPQGYRSSVTLSKNFVNKFDIIIINNREPNLDYVLNLNPRGKVIYRTYDYHSPRVETKIEDLKNDGRLEILRLFDWEDDIEWSSKSNHCILSHVDENIYKEWSGEENQILTFCSNFDGKTRHRDPLYGIFPYRMANTTYKSIVENYNHRLHGHSNRSGHGPVDFNTQLELYKKSRIYFNLSCPPAWHNYGLMEAMMTGCPTISFDEVLGGFNHPHYSNAFRLKTIIPNSNYGLVSDYTHEIVDYIEKLRSDHSFAKEVSENSRKQALKHFSKARAIKDWKNFVDIFKN